MTAQWSMRVFRDSLVNLMSGLGVPGRDKAASGSAAFVYTPLSQMECEAAYRSNWLARKLIDIPAQDATRAWRAWQADTNQVEAIEEVEQKLNIAVILKNALCMARLYGGAALVLGVDQGKANEPLILEKVGKDDLKFVVACSRYTLGHGTMVTDVLSPEFGKPEYFTRNIAALDTRDQDFRIHPSRVVMLKGMQVPDPITIGEIWGDSVLQVVLDAVTSATSVVQSVAALVAEAKVDVIHIPDLSQNLASQEYANALTARFAYANVAKSVVNTLLLDKEEEWERITANFTTLPDILQMFLLIVSGAADIPATRMLGQSPAGLNATGDADLRNYYDRVNSDQTAVLGPALATLDDLLIRSALGARDPSTFYIWNPLWQLSGEEKAKVAKSKADTFKIDVDTGLLDQEALRIGRQNQLIEDATYPGLEQALEEQEQLDLESMISVEEQEAQAEAEQRKQLAMGAAAGNAFPQPGGGAGKPGQPGKPKTNGSKRPGMRDFNPAHMPGGTREGGQFAPKGEGGAGERAEHLHHRQHLQRTPSVEPSDAAQHKALHKKWVELNISLLKHIDEPEAPIVKATMEEMKGLVKDMYRLHVDPGTIAGITQPGGPRDVLIVGAGPGGLAAAINGGTEGLDTLLVEEQEVPGGQAKMSSRIENYPGFPIGVTGERLTRSMFEQAQAKGAETRLGVKVTEMRYDEQTGIKRVSLSDGTTIETRAVILASGVRFRRMDFPGSDGPGVILADPKALNKASEGKDSVVIGGSNGAAQAALGVAEKGRHVTIMARGDITDSMSATQVLAVRNHPKISVIEGDAVERLERDASGNPTMLHTVGGRAVPANAIGIFIGSAPDTRWLPETVDRDKAGRVVTDKQLKTGIPGVWAIGDVRDDAIGRIGIAVGEGIRALGLTFKYFEKLGYVRPKDSGFQDTHTEADNRRFDALVDQLFALDLEYPYLGRMIEEPGGELLEELAAEKKRLEAHDYDPDQPRVPAGHTGGGQWSKSAAGATPGGLSERGGVSGGAGRLAASRRADLTAPLRDLPRKVKIPGHADVEAGPYPPARQAAYDYTTKAGIDYRPPRRYVKVDPERATRIAKAFDEMRHDPHHPEVAAAYKAMADETVAQWREIERTGLNVDWIDFAKQGDPYAASPRLATEDVRNNNHLWVFPTSSGFGSDESFDATENPLLADTGIVIKGHKLVVNDVFRIVHDYFGHIKEGNGFRADGEENAWRSHSAMFSPLARRAMTTETRGQNSWVNYGPYGEQNRTASSGDTHFADQKVGLLPEWVVHEASGADEDALHHDFNQYHKGTGEGGGQFTTGGGQGGGGALTEERTSKGGGALRRGAGAPAAKQTDITQNLSGVYGESTQPVASLDELYERARKVEPKFQQEMEGFVAKFGGKVIYPPAHSAEPGTRMKNRASSERKLKAELNGDPTLLRDVLRATVSFDDVKGTREAASDFIANNDVLRVKDRFVAPVGGYRDLMLNYRTADGIVAEVQFNTPSLLEAKHTRGHDLYEETRALMAGGRSPEMDAKIKHNMMEAEQLYKDAFDKDGDHRGW